MAVEVLNSIHEKENNTKIASGKKAEVSLYKRLNVQS
jgi:hypothetical protein